MIKKAKAGRLNFVDAIRAWAILMMLQGHFISALLADEYRDKDNIFFAIWSYLRGITAPVFFTIAGFIFTLILIRNFDKGWANPRVKKGIIRGFQLIAIGYLLQIRFGRLFKGSINDSYVIVHVLQCLGLAIILLVIMYLVCHTFKRHVLLLVFVAITGGLFFFKTAYEQWDYSFLPELLSNYFTSTNGSVFTIVPWFGFTSFGGFLALIFTKYHRTHKFYIKAIVLMILSGIFLITTSYEITRNLYDITGFQIFDDALLSSYLFARIGVVLLVFSCFMLFRRYLNNKILLSIGQLTLPIYVVHAIVLYNSVTGHGLSRYFYHALTPWQVLVGAICFMFLICLVVLALSKNKKLFHLLRWYRN